MEEKEKRRRRNENVGYMLSVTFGTERKISGVNLIPHVCIQIKHNPR